MKRSLRPLASHALALLAGALLAPPVAGIVTRLRHGSPHDPAGPPAASADAPSGTGENTELSTHPVTRSQAFREAWRQLSLRPASREQRLDSQTEMLRRWADFDLEGAVHAAAAEGFTMAGETSNFTRLCRAFQESFTAHPDEAWRILAKEPPHPGWEQLQTVWFNTLFRRDAKLPAVFPEMSARDQQRTVITIADCIGTSESRSDAILRLATGSRITEAQLTDLLLFTQPGSAAASPAWMSQPPGLERVAARLDWAATLGRLDPAAFSTAWESVPEADRAEVARLTLRKLSNDSPVLIPALDHLIETGQWDALRSDTISRVLTVNAADTSTSGQGNSALLDWTLALPDRPEAADFLRHLISGNPLQAEGEAREWLDSLPAGSWQHDEALLIQIGNNPGSPSVQSTASQISDPARRRQAQEILRRQALLKSLQ